jgi:uncharacterized pyridoxal phosphate-containing UPF0001 family protein
VARLDPGRVRENVQAIRAEIGDAVQILAAVKYLDVEDLGALHEGGVTLAGENRAQQLELKQTAHPEFTWDFIGQLQSRKVKAVLPLVRWIHSVGSDSAIRELNKHATPETEVLLEINIAGEEGKSGFAPAELVSVLEQLRCNAVGLMTMPPLAEKPEDSRRWFAALAQLASDHGLRELSMGTTQDYRVAAEEGSTIVRIGTKLFS